jgi:hypothetical protein
MNGWTRLFVSKFIRLVASSCRGDTGFCKLGGMAGPAASCSLTEKLQDVNAVSVFNTMFIDTMFIVLVSQGKSRKSSEKCWYLDQESSRPLLLSPNQSPCSVLGLRRISK